MNLKDIFNKFKKKFLKFWKSEDTKVSLLRDIFIALVFVLIILLVLWTYTGQWFGAPMVAIESGSMMHQNEPFGRIGTIDAGDMVFLVKTNGRNDISTYIDRNPAIYQYEKYGDVIVYKPYGNDDVDQIIHRAMCWVEYNEKYNTYTVEGYGIYNVSKVTIPELGLDQWTIPKKDPYGNVIIPHSGFITKGDNQQTNDKCDQVGGICVEPIKAEWVTGKARGELPWIGTLNLLFNDILGGKSTVSNVPSDCIICLIIFIAVLISIPVILDFYSYFREKKKHQL